MEINRGLEPFRPAMPANAVWSYSHYDCDRLARMPLRILLYVVLTEEKERPRG